MISYNACISSSANCYADCCMVSECTCASVFRTLLMQKSENLSMHPVASIEPATPISDDVIYDELDTGRDDLDLVCGIHTYAYIHTYIPIHVNARNASSSTKSSH